MVRGRRQGRSHGARSLHRRGHHPLLPASEGRPPGRHPGDGWSAHHLRGRVYPLRQLQPLLLLRQPRPREAKHPAGESSAATATSGAAVRPCTSAGRFVRASSTPLSTPGGTPPSAATGGRTSGGTTPSSRTGVDGTLRSAPSPAAARSLFQSCSGEMWPLGFRDSDESGDPRRRVTGRESRGERRPAEADGRNWREADDLAHHEDLLGPWGQRFRHLLRLQGLHDQGVFRELFRFTSPI